MCVSLCLSEPSAEAAGDGQTAADESTVVAEPEDDYLSDVVRCRLSMLFFYYLCRILSLCHNCDSTTIRL